MLEANASVQSWPIPRGSKLTLSNSMDLENPDNDILYRDIAKIIDGQHRVKAFEEGFIDNFEINVSIFVGADVATQAEIFSTVNLAQTKVNRSLVYDLFSLAQTRSPEKSAHEITVLLDRREDSPFHKRIKRLGTATEGRFGETLSQATVVKGILSHITKNTLRFIKPVILSYATEPKLVPRSHFEMVLSKIRKVFTDDQFTTETYPPGTSGESKLYQDLMQESGLNSSWDA